MEKIVFETFRQLSPISIMDLVQSEPSCFNGIVRVKKYKITIEEIEEPTETVQKRIKKLWKDCNNWHNHEPLRVAAKKYGLGEL